MSPVDTIFRASWDALDAGDVEAFLADATEEGLTWEAKREQPRPASLAKAGCGMANAIGGFVLLGAVRDEAGTWRLPGATFSVDEPGTWVTSVLGARLRPVPDLDVKVFDRPSDRKAVVIRVQPVGAPPCITSDGIVYQRVSGQTVPVTDPVVMADLLARGRAARQATEAAARDAAGAIYGRPRVLEGADPVFALGVAPLSHVADKAAQLFSPPFAEALRDRAATLKVLPDVQSSPAAVVSQDALVYAVGVPGVGAANFLAASWTGAVAVGHESAREVFLQDVLPSDIARAWRTAVGALSDYGGAGDVHVAILLNREKLSERRMGGIVEVRRWSALRQPTDEEIASVEREVKRAFGQAVLEG